MKRKVFLFICLLAVCWGACDAQDVIITRDAKKINAKVTEVNIDNVRYKNFDNQNGPTYTILKSQIASIMYKNGTVETFIDEAEKPAAPPVTPQPATTQPATAPPATPQQQAPETAPAPNPVAVQPGVRSGNVLADMMKNRPDLYRQYGSGNRQARLGGIFMIVGGVMAGGGLIGMVASEDSESYDICAGFFITGDVILTVGIPITIVGSVKRGRALRAYQNSVYGETKPAAPHLQLNLHGNGLGLAYVF
jgi:hypothetical protein